MKAVKFSIAAAAALALTVPATLSAEDAGFTNKNGTSVNLSGSFRVRGHSLDGYYKGTIGKDAQASYYDTRFRLKLDAQTESGASLHLRTTMLEADLGTASGGGVDSAWELHGDDYAYVKVPMGEQLSVSAGRIVDSFGNGAVEGFASSYGLAYDTIDAAYALNDNMTVGFWTAKSEENSDEVVGNDVPADEDEYALYVDGAAGGFNFGAQLVMLSKPKTAGSKDTDGGTKFGLHAAGAVGGATVLAEMEMQTGDAYSTTDDPMGVMLGAVMPMGDLSAGAVLAMTMDGYEASKYFTPTALFGTAAPTAVFDFGAVGGDTTALVLPVTFKVSDALTAKATLAHATFDTLDKSITELDLGMSYKIAGNVNYYATIGMGTLSEKITYGDGDGETSNDSLMAMTHGLKMKF